MSDLVQLFRALEFAAAKHRDHRRKGVASEPYINHLTEVARLLAEATAGDDLVLLIGGLLHDTIEDTDTTRAQLEEAFGPQVADLVAEVTDDKSLLKSERKRLQVERAPTSSRRAKLIKLADKTSNLRSLVHSPPRRWNRARKIEYINWAREVIEGCRGVSEKLEGWFDDACSEALRDLEET